MTLHHPPKSRLRRVGVSAVALALVAPLFAALTWTAQASGANLTATLVRTTNLGALNPPIPDPSGLTYIPSRDRLLISDGEVDEMPIYQGSNLFETTRTGVIQDRGDTEPQTHEPVGVSYQSSNNHLLVVDDDQQRVHDFAPGVDNRFGTADDARTFFSTAAFGSTDPEDVLFYPPTGEIFVLEGSDNDVYRVAPGPNGVFDGVPPVGDDTAVEFDTLNFGADDPEGIAYHPTRGTLLIVDFQTNRVYELNRELMLINVIDISASHQLKAAAIAVAPATDDPNRSDLYIVDRGIDNDTDPNEKDGKLYEMSVQLPAIPNLAPIVSGGRDTATHVAEPVTLRGSVRDDGRPQPAAAVSATWSKVSGPGTASFAAAFSPQTTVTFSAAGTYQLRLTANDSALSGSDDVTVQVAEPGAALSFAIPVTKAFDDVEEPPNGWVDWLSTSLNLPNAGGTTAQTVALRFTGLDVPRGATITSASIQFTSKSARSGATTMQVRAVAADNTPTFSMLPSNVSVRPRTTASVAWSPPAWTAFGQAGAAQRSTDLRTVVQEVTNRAGWVRGNALAFVITGTGERMAQSQEDGGIAPVLHLSYTTSDSPPTGQIAFRGASRFIGNVTNASVTVPPSVQPGDALILTATMNAATATLAAPAGWTQVTDLTISTARTLVWRRVALAGDAGRAITVGSSAIAKFAVQLAAYSGTSTSNPVAAVTTNTESASLTNHTTPSVSVGSPGSWLVSYWADKSSATTDWTAPAGVVVRDEAIGTGSGRIGALLGDSGGPVPPGTAAGRTATTDSASRAATVSIVLAAAP